MNDQQLDDFFRKAAEQYDVPYNPRAWEQMSHRLDQADGRGGFWSRKVTTGLILLLLLGGLVVGYQELYNQEEAHSYSPEAAAPTFSTISGSTSSQQDALAPRTLSNTPPVLNRANTSQAVEPEESSAISPAHASPETAPSVLTTTVFLTEVSASDHISFIDRHPAAQFHQRLGSTGGVIPVKRFTSSIKPTPPQEKDVIRPEPSLARYRLSLGISPDISSIKIGQASRVGRKISVQFEYFLLRKLSLTVGSMLSYKTYAAPGEAYRPYPGYWKKYPLPNKVNGQCQVLDIPLNVRYYALSLNRARLFVSSGLSSYLMLREDYEYVYPYANNYERHERNANQHYFKVANLSLGYERAWGKRGAIQIEPFVKLPLAGVGFGRIRLATIGTVFSWHYRMGR